MVVISGYLGVDPGVVLVGVLFALRLVVDDVDVEAVAFLVDALEELAAEELDAHDGEDEPEDEAHEQHVEDGRNGVHQRVHHDLEERTSHKKTLFYYYYGFRTKATLVARRLQILLTLICEFSHVYYSYYICMICL